MFEIALALVPLLMLLASLLLGHYPGFEAIVRLAEQLSPRPRWGGAKGRPRLYCHRSRAIAGGLLIAFGLAQRPPPLAA